MEFRYSSGVRPMVLPARQRHCYAVDRLWMAMGGLWEANLKTISGFSVGVESYYAVSRPLAPLLRK